MTKAYISGTYGGLALALLMLAGAVVAGALRPRAAPWIAGSAALGLAALLAWAGILDVTRMVDLSWNPALGSRLILELDDLGAPLAVFAMGLAGPILYYTAGYLPHHLAEQRRGIGEQGRFCALMLGFAGAMVLLLLAHDLLVLFAALELTALASFLLIEFDRTGPARRAASMALAVTVGSSLLFLTGVLLIAAETGTTTLPQLRESARQGSVSGVAVTCLAAGVLAKSAQVPLHFWLPRAMVAPTPVSSYLHSATLVAAGVFVLQRLYFLLEGVPSLLVALQVVGLGSIVVGSLMALVARELKRILAYSTIAQYGHVVVLIGLASPKGLMGAALFLVAHGVCKCALFLTAGAVTQCTGAKELSAVGGLGRRMPWLAGASLIAAAGLAGFPATIGYFKDELWLGAALDRGLGWGAAAALVTALTFAYIGRFWLGIFAGPSPPGTARPGALLTGPIIVLAVLVVIGGFWSGPLQVGFAAAAEVAGARAVGVELGYHWLSPETGLAAGAWGLGVGLLLSRRWWHAPLERMVDGVARHFGPAKLADQCQRGAHAVSDWFHQVELRDLRDRIMAVLAPTAVLLVLGIVGRGRFTAPIGDFGWESLPLAAALIVTAGTALATLFPVEHLPLILLLSFVGFSLALCFAISGAPDVALVVVLVETIFTILFLAVLWHIRPASLASVRDRRQGRLGPWPGLVTGVVAFFPAWFALASTEESTVAWAHVRLAEQAHAGDVVTAILADFRGLDTAGEITVLAVAVLGAAAIIGGREP